MRSGTLVGKYAFLWMNDTYKLGKLIRCVHDEFYLVEMLISKNGHKSYEVYNIGQMAQLNTESFGDGDGQVCDVAWSFFDSRKELDDYVAWLNAPPEENEQEDNVVKVNKFQRPRPVKKTEELKGPKDEE